MANSRSRKAAPTRPGATASRRPDRSATRPASAALDETVKAEPADEPADEPAAAPSKPAASASRKTGSSKATASKTGSAKTSETKASAAKVAATGASTAKASTKKASASGSSAGKRFGDGGPTASGGSKGSPPTKKGGRGGRAGRPAPSVRVAKPKPWGMIAATLVVLLFAGGAIGYAVYQANSNAVPEKPADIEGISILEYAAGQEHVTTDVNYTESPAVGGPHDGYWADCDGAVYDQQVRSENAVHSLEHGAVWITYNPDQVSDSDLTTLRGYVENQPYMLMSPYSGLTSGISLQSWNHQLFLDAADDPRINEFIQLLRQNAEEYPEVGATCTQPTFLQDPVIEGEQSRVPEGTEVTDAPTTP